MSRGSKDKYTDKQKRKAQHIEEGYEKKGVSSDEAESRAWATVNKQSGGGEAKGGSGRKTSSTAKRSARQSSARTAARTRSKSSELSSMTREELYDQARKLELPGRSRMRKNELINALARAS